MSNSHTAEDVAAESQIREHYERWRRGELPSGDEAWGGQRDSLRNAPAVDASVEQSQSHRTHSLG
jgi:hypothetical protein